ncbi:RHS repeat-associated core domain-containing protein [Pseudomonas sp. Z1-12]|uniref:RHS repeat-associated core domain-containing protein n=1 Tax=Pseudomonas sp. Z1-12 TaxID=2817408 RepID=UPI003DA9E904
MDALKKLGKKLGVGLLALMLNTVTIADTITYFHNDISGSPMAATDAAGNLLWKENYKPYGDKLNRSAPSSSNKIGYHGKAYDDATGLSYMGARYYDPVLGRFMGIDPVDFQTDNLHSFNRYAYTNNNPYKYVDPDGRFAFLVVPAFYALTALAGALTVNTMLNGGGGQSGDDFSFGGSPGSATQISDVSTSTTYNSESTKGDREGSGFPDRELPRDRNGNPVRDPEAEGAHTQLGQKEGRRGKYDQGREWDANGRPVKDIDFTDHGRPKNHTNPHEHPYLPNPTGGTLQHGPARPLQN